MRIKSFNIHYYVSRVSKLQFRFGARIDETYTENACMHDMMNGKTINDTPLPFSSDVEECRERNDRGLLPRVQHVWCVLMYLLRFIYLPFKGKYQT